MENTYKITGMTCNGCVASVRTKLSGVSGVTDVTVDLEQGEAKVSMTEPVPTEKLKAALPNKYSISDKEDAKPNKPQGSPNRTSDGSNGVPKGSNGVPKRSSGTPESTNKATGYPENKSSTSSGAAEPSKISQLKPLLLIFAYLFAAAYFLNFREWDTGEAMLDLMGLFYIVFSFFKLLDLKGFPDSFRMYDPLAKAVPAYGWVYPFIEVALGLLFLFRFQITAALWLTILILGITTFGVAKTLLDKKSIRCACLGTALQLPMTEATLIENTIMLVMAFWMLFFV